VLKLVQHFHLLIPMLRSSAIRPEEEALRVALDEIEEQVRGPGVGHIRGKLNELWALVGAVNAARERGRKNGAGPTDGNMEWAVVDDEGLSQITQVFRLGLFIQGTNCYYYYFQILTEQQAGLAHLTKILQGALKDLDIIQGTGEKRDDDHRVS